MRSFVSSTFQVGIIYFVAELSCLLFREECSDSGKFALSNLYLVLKMLFVVFMNQSVFDFIVNC